MSDTKYVHLGEEEISIFQSIAASLEKIANPPIIMDDHSNPILLSTLPQYLAGLREALDSAMKSQAYWCSRYDEAISHSLPHRRDPVATYIKRWRNRYDENTSGWIALDNLLDDYRLHADTGTKLSDDVRIGDES
jgi:hypothetical protein